MLFACYIKMQQPCYSSFSFFRFFGADPGHPLLCNLLEELGYEVCLSYCIYSVNAEPKSFLMMSIRRCWFCLAVLFYFAIFLFHGTFLLPRLFAKFLFPFLHRSMQILSLKQRLELWSFHTQVKSN